MKLPKWIRENKKIAPHIVGIFVLVTFISFTVSLTHSGTATAAITGCSVTQNGVNVTDDPNDTSNPGKAVPGIYTDWKYNVALTTNEKYTGYVWNMYFDGVKQAAPIGTSTDLLLNNGNSVTQPGNHYVENYSINAPKTVKKITVVLTINYVRISDSSTQTWNQSCTTFFKDLTPDMAKSTMVVTSPASGPSTNGKATIKVTMMTADGVPIPNTPIDLTKFSGPTGTPTITPVTAITDSSGVANFNIGVTYLGLDIYTAKVQNTSLILNTKVGVTYALAAIAAPTNFQRVSDVVTGTDPASGKLLHDITLKWDSVAGATSYNVKYSANSGGPYALGANVPSSPTTFHNVLPGTYWDVVTAVKGTQESPPSSELYLVAGNNQAAAPMAKPLNFKVAGIAAVPGSTPPLYDVTLQWDPVAGAAGYNIKFATSAGGTYTTVPGAAAGSWYTVATSSVTFKNLQAGTVYDVVSAVAPSRAEGPNSDQLVVTIGSGTVGGAICGNNTCESSESNASCPADCKAPAAPTAVCGDGTCQSSESATSCASDCSAPPGGGSSDVCGDGTCGSSENATSCASDCSAPSGGGSSDVCGDGTCGASEDASSCPNDCSSGALSGSNYGNSSGNDNSGGTGSLSDSGTGNASGGQAGAVNLKPADDILSCQPVKPNAILSTFTSAIIRCKLQKPPYFVTAKIVKGDYTPPNDPDPTAVAKTVLNNKQVSLQVVSLTWNGIDDYDQPAAEGDYTFVVSATPDAQTAPDISIQKIHVMQNPPVQTQEASSTQPGGQSSQPKTPKPAPKPPEPSKCPDVNYPIDIDGHWAKDFIRLGYDLCVFRGYKDGSFHPDGKISRAEAVKAALVAAGIAPKYGCWDTDCGSPFFDLVMWEGQWLRPAADLKIVKGVAEHAFAPERSITRGEASVLTAKAFRLKPYDAKLCWSPNCGAGYPNNFFIDITDKVQGSYLRALWDKGIIKGTGPNAFDPTRPMTRAEFATLLIKTGEVLGKIKASAPQTPAPSPAPAPVQQTTSSTQQSTTQESLQTLK